MALADQPRIVVLALAESLRRLRRRFAAGSGQLRIGGPVPERLLLAPPDLATGDPTVAQDIYAGEFYFAGEKVLAGGGNPFAVVPPSEAWLRELHGFGWLRHLSASQNAISARHARMLVKDWIAAHGRPSATTTAWTVEVAGARLIAWLCHSVLLVEGAALPEYRRLMRAIGQHVRYLRAAAPQAEDGLPLLTAYIALAYADVCVPGRIAGGAQARRNLDRELDRQVLPDGGHLSRNPAVLAPLLALLLPLRQSQARLGEAPSQAVVSAIDRMIPALRFYRMGDGSLARFNGVSTTPHDLIATILRYDDALGAPPDSASFSAYERIGAGDSVLLCDVGAPAKGELSKSAHAGCLAFEFSDGTAPMVVNCGLPPNPDDRTADLARMTAAHSTVTLNDTSSCRFNVAGFMGSYLESRIISGPAHVTCSRRADDEGIAIEASHDGYVRSFGVVHERMLRVTEDGTTLMGMDRLVTPDGKPPRHVTRDDAAIRFHLHPSVEIVSEQGGQDVTLKLANGSLWVFTCVDAEPVVEESIFFAAAGGARKARQICLHARISQQHEIRWIFQRR